MEDLVYDILKREAEEIGILVCRSENIEFVESMIMSYEFRKDFVVEVTAIKNGREITFDVTEKKYGELFYNEEEIS